jgi:hypothetical protein
MNQDFEDFLTKKNEVLNAECGCGLSYYIFVQDLLEDCFSTCPRCGKKVYALNCKKCMTGYSYDEDSKLIDKINQSWKCDFCKNMNQGLPQVQVKGYKEEDLPENIKKVVLVGSSIIKWVVIAVVLVISYIWFRIRI